VPFYPETGLGFQRDGRGWGHLVVQVHDEVAFPANQVGMVLGLDVVAGHLMQGIDLDDQTLIAENLQGLVNGIEGDGRHLLTHLVINLLRGGVVPP